jgi:chromosome segregation ATPase
MTLLGKILVFLTFVAALGMGGLMLYLSKTSQPWKDLVEDRDAHIRVLEANAKAEIEARKRLARDNDRLKQQLDAVLLESRGEIQRREARADEAEKQRDVYKLQMGQATMALEQAKKEAVRLQSELNYTLTVIEAREKSIIKLQDEILGHIQAAQAAKNERDTAVARAQALLEIVREKEVAIQKLTEKLKNPGGTVVAITDPNRPDFKNPPPVNVKGEVMAVDRNLLKISLGTDQGVRKDHTLEMYRLNPEVKYLGRIVITDADFRHSIARFIAQPGTPMPALAVGDIVATKIQ